MSIYAGRTQEFALRAEQNHPLIKAYEGSVLAEFKTDGFDEYARVVGNADGENQVERLEGRLTRLRYRNPPDRAPLEIVRNYEEALVGQGLTIDYRCSGPRECGNQGRGHQGFPGWQALNGMNFGISPDVRYFTGQFQHEDQRVYVSVGANSTIHYVHLLEVTAMETGKVVVDAAALSSALDRQGRVIVEGIFFDTDSAVLKPESNPALAEVASLLKVRPEIRLHVVGHTDPTGQFDHNLRLSQGRAEAVVTSLVEAHRINRARLRAHGVGPLAPAASNQTSLPLFDCKVRGMINRRPRCLWRLENSLGRFCTFGLKSDRQRRQYTSSFATSSRKLRPP